jgi:Cu/Ag efflux pump CusA
MLSVPFALVDGMVSSKVLTLIVIPAIYGLVKG